MFHKHGWIPHLGETENRATYQNPRRSKRALRTVKGRFNPPIWGLKKIQPPDKYVAQKESFELLQRDSTAQCAFWYFREFADFSRGQFWPYFLTKPPHGHIFLNAAEIRIWGNFKNGPPLPQTASLKKRVSFQIENWSLPRLGFKRSRRSFSGFVSRASLRKLGIGLWRAWGA